MVLGWLRRALHPREIARQAKTEYGKAHALAERLSAGAETLAESAQFLERSASAASETVARLEAVVAGGLDDVVAASPRLSDSAVRSFVGGKPDDLTPAAAALLDFAAGHDGFAAQRGLWFNPPVCVRHVEGDVLIGPVNERIVEAPFALAALAALPVGSVIADIGAAESTLSLSLASLGHQVHAVDPRGYSLTHPNLTVVPVPLAAWDRPAQSLDAVVCISVIEHLGLNAYGEGDADQAGDAAALRRIKSLLKADGLLVLTVPAGPWNVGPSERTYDLEHLDQLLEGWRVEERVFVEREVDGTWARQPNTDLGNRHGVFLVTARA